MVQFGTRTDRYLLCSIMHRIPIQVWTGPKGGRRLRFPGYLDSRCIKVAMLSAPRTVRHYPTRRYSWYSFLLEAESTSAPWCGRKDYVNEKSQ